MTLPRTLSVLSSALVLVLVTSCRGPKMTDTTVRDDNGNNDLVSTRTGSSDARKLATLEPPYPGAKGDPIDLSAETIDPSGGVEYTDLPGLGDATAVTGLSNALDPDAGRGSVSEDPLEIIYFAYDRHEIGDSERPKLDYAADYLVKNKQYNLLIGGHCDERGDDEYNRALGERRALAARDYLLTRGVDQARIQTISYGEERPAVIGNSESEYSKNRRAELLLVTPVADTR